MNDHHQTVGRGYLKFNLLKTGDIFDIVYQDNQINLLKGNLLDGTITNLYLRIKNENGYTYTKMIGSNSPSRYQIIDQKIIYQGTFEYIKYQVTIEVFDQFWTVDVALSGNRKNVDVFYGQDVAISKKANILSSEAYTAQYIDHRPFQTPKGYTVCSRQNQGQPQTLQLGSITENVGYVTDGFQFFGLSYKETNMPEALSQDRLPAVNYQYEFPYVVLQSNTIQLNGEARVAFYGLYHPNHYPVLEQPFSTTSVEKAFQPQPFLETGFQTVQSSMLSHAEILKGQNLSEKDIQKQYQTIRHPEYDVKGQLLAFFSDDHRHIVLKAKELLTERPHGHLLLHGDLLHVSEEVMAQTNFMFGVFSSHVVLGNTSFNKFNSNIRNPLNVLKISGQRIYLKEKGTYQLLGLPSLYEMGANFVRWQYVLQDDVIEVVAYAGINHLQQELTFQSKKQYDILVTNQLVMGSNEYESDIMTKIEGNQVTVSTTPDSLAHGTYPDLRYRLISRQDVQIQTDEQLFNQTTQGLVLMTYQQTNQFNISTQATIQSDFDPLASLDFGQEAQKAVQYLQSLAKNLKLSHPTKQHQLEKLEDIAFWYTHNALTHYASPHGLEQYNGAAWGTRDVCQGPFEFFNATQRFDISREIILKTYSRQFLENGDFPQWFMFDKYYRIHAHEAHGDIIVWPLKAVGDYLKATNDLTILAEKVPYMSLETHDFTEPETLLKHLEKQIQAIKDSFILGYALPGYGGGDWDDTLQPANAELRSKMVSGWTVVLLYEALSTFNAQIESAYPKLHQELKKLIAQIQNDYQEHMIVDGLPAGFVIFNDQKTYLLHPRDSKTGLKYRLLPFTRSMIAELAHPNQLSAYQDIIAKHLKHPDGIRLMDTAVDYKGGITTYFARAETAANFGREIGLLYVHAHIRYVEAMAKIGNKEEAYQSLFLINPIGIQEEVPNAIYRQSNVYFSSSDANFYDRYQAKRDFDLLRTGEIGVKGGWRLYSSGPGIYFNQMIANVIGLRVENQGLRIDPVIPDHLSGLKVQYQFNDLPLEVTYYQGKPKLVLNQKELKLKASHNHYRSNGFFLTKETLQSLKSPIQIKVWLP